MKQVLSPGFTDAMGEQAQRRRPPEQRRAWGRFAVLVEGLAEFVSLFGKTALRLHRRRHRSRSGSDRCSKVCAARNLYVYALFQLPPDLEPRALPLRPIIIPRIERILDCKLPPDFQRDIGRDLKALRAALSVAPKLRSHAHKRIVRCYAGPVADWIERIEPARQSPWRAEQVAHTERLLLGRLSPPKASGGQPQRKVTCSSRNA